MATPTETFVLAKMTGKSTEADILRIIRTYLSEKRAEQDRDLLSRTDPQVTYRILPVDHIDE